MLPSSLHPHHFIISNQSWDIRVTHTLRALFVNVFGEAALFEEQLHLFFFKRGLLLDFLLFYNDHLLDRLLIEVLIGHHVV